MLEIDDLISGMRENSEHVEMLGDDAVIERMAEGDEEAAVDAVMRDAAEDLDGLIAELSSGLEEAREARTQMEAEVRDRVGALSPEYQRLLEEQTAEEQGV